MTSAVLMTLKRLGVRRSCKKNSWVSSNGDQERAPLSTTQIYDIATTHVFMTYPENACRLKEVEGPPTWHHEVETVLKLMRANDTDEN